MLQSTKAAEGSLVEAADGPIGRLTNFYFDDESWVIRYLVVDTGDWLSHRQVLISPLSLGRPDWSKKALRAAVTRSQVEGSPNWAAETVSRNEEVGYLGYYDYPNYWGGGGLWGAGISPDALLAGQKIDASDIDRPRTTPPVRRRIGATAPGSVREKDDARLRNGNEVMRYYVHGSDGDIGHVQGMLFDEATWAIHYVIVNTSNWWIGHQVLIAPEWIDSIFWAESKLMVTETRETIRNAPRYDGSAPLMRAEELVLHRHHGRRGYWEVGAE